jgi:uncharacterized protein YrrD
MDIPKPAAITFKSTGIQPMLVHTKDLEDYTVKATNDIEGHIEDLYFDDLYWNIQSMIVKTGILIDEKTILLSEKALGKPDINNHVLPVSVSFESNGQQIDEPFKPISRAKSDNANQILKWPLNQLNLKSLDQPELNNLITNMSESSGRLNQKTNPHLRSWKEVLGYNINAKDGEIGHVDDFIVETENWKIRYLIIDTRNWLPGGKDILISPAWIEKIKWSSNLVFIDLKKKSLKESPPYDADKPLDDKFELKLFKYYGQQRLQNND